MIRLQRASILPRLRRDRSAIVALEFALVAPVFFLLMIFIMDTGLQMFEQADLDEATLVASRALMTGTSEPTVKQFDTTLCNSVGGLIPCNEISFQVTTAAPNFIQSTNANGNTTYTPVTAQFSGLTAVAPSSTTGFYSCTYTIASANGACTYPTATTLGTAATAYLVQVAYLRTYLATSESTINQIFFPTVFSTQVFLSEPWCNSTSALPC